MPRIVASKLLRMPLMGRAPPLTCPYSLNTLSQLEREQVLHERAERRQQLLERREVRKKLREGERASEQQRRRKYSPAGVAARDGH
jgi:hypothetical protein